MTDLKFGRRPPTNAPALMLGPLLTGVVPPHPTSVDNLAILSSWAMLGNDTYGDCVAVTWANVRRLVSAELGIKEVYPSLSQVLEFYKTQNPGFPAEDNGMVIQDALHALNHDGGPDGVKALGYAKVDPTSVEQVKAAIAIFGSVWTGINVQQANMDDFNAGRPWDYHPGNQIVGGHSIITGGYSAQASNDERFITWAKETGFTDAFWGNLVEEAWVVIWPEHLGSKAFLDGIDQKALADAYLALTGRPFPGAAPATEPVSPADTTLASAVRVWAFARHSGSNRNAALAFQAWLRAKGLA